MTWDLTRAPVVVRFATANPSCPAHKVLPGPHFEPEAAFISYPNASVKASLAFRSRLGVVEKKRGSTCSHEFPWKIRPNRTKFAPNLELPRFSPDSFADWCRHPRSLAFLQGTVAAGCFLSNQGSLLLLSTSRLRIPRIVCNNPLSSVCPPVPTCFANIPVLEL